MKLKENCNIIYRYNVRVIGRDVKTVKAKSHIAKLTALSLLATMLFGGAASADSVKVTADELNIRKDADVKSRIVGLVEEGDELSFVSENGDWYQVKNGDDTGFHGKHGLAGFLEGAGIYLAQGEG